MHIKVAGAEFASELLLCSPVFMLTALVLAEVAGGLGRGACRHRKLTREARLREEASRLRLLMTNLEWCVSMNFSCC